MEFEDYYKTLGVSRNATAKEIKDAYRRSARKHHPDMNKGDPRAEARFKQINEANEVLSDPEKRRRYDELGARWKDFDERGEPPGSGPFHWQSTGGRGGAGPEGFSEFFRTFFGGGGFGGFEGGGIDDLLGGRGGGDIEQPVEINLEDVSKGTSRLVAIAGRPKKLEVRIPAGVRDGTRVRVAGEGATSRGGGRRGDFYLRVKVRPHDRFERRGDDLAVRVAVPLSTAVLGGEVAVPTLAGTVSIRVPKGTSPGQTMRVREQGLPRLDPGGGKGDLLVTLDVAMPKALGRREQELFEELRSLGL